ncbi:hypothetical protein ABZ307_37355 [Streptomyces griseorubiginosus]|uniref:hypothetical protein n=1 Tax=Streptomyces griseorubiginosus TaxID=67304 RepID=UPI0033A16A57
MPQPNDNTQGCTDSRKIDGKFNLQLGDNFTYQRSDGSWRTTRDIAPIDLHQLGAGYDGHVWFTHTYAGGNGNGSAASDADLWHKVSATWTPSPELMAQPGTTGVLYNIYVHLPNHGAQGKVAYNVHVGTSGQGVTERTTRRTRARPVIWTWPTTRRSSSRPRPRPPAPASTVPDPTQRRVHGPEPAGPWTPLFPPAESHHAPSGPPSPQRRRRTGRRRAGPDRLLGRARHRRPRFVGVTRHDPLSERPAERLRR